MKSVLQYARDLPAKVRAELEQLLANFAPVWDKEHKGDGTHGNVTAETVAVRCSVGNDAAAPGNKLSVVGLYTVGDDVIPALGVNGGKFAVLNGGGTGSGLPAGRYGLLVGVAATGNAFFQVQRIDGTAVAYNLLLQPNGGNVGIGTAAPGSKLAVVGLQTYADNAAALTGGLVAGDFYRTAAGVLMVTY